MGILMIDIQLAFRLRCSVPPMCLSYMYLATVWPHSETAAFCASFYCLVKWISRTLPPFLSSIMTCHYETQ